ncbi:hypothetical protein CVT24_001668, partial [Panaeolus cyanescens]
MSPYNHQTSPPTVTDGQGLAPGFSKPRPRGRPKGSKDGPRKEGAPPRGRPLKSTSAQVSTSSPQQRPCEDTPSVPPSADDDEAFDVEDLFTEDFLSELDKIDPSSSMSASSNQPVCEVGQDRGTTKSNVTRRQLEVAAEFSKAFPFFTSREAFVASSFDDEEDGDVDIVQSKGKGTGGDQTSFTWFRQPQTMPDWEYYYFIHTIRPMITTKVDRTLQSPQCYRGQSMWIEPPDPVFSLARAQLDPTLLYLPRVFLWLPHFLVTSLNCPYCSNVLEKNGPLPPRRVSGLDQNFRLVSWGYYCRDGCKTHFAGWSQALIDSLPAHVRLSFPAVLSHRSGLSREVVTLLRVSNQHKMGPHGVRALLLEAHTQRFNRLLLQYLEVVLERVTGRETALKGTVGTQTTLHAFTIETKMRGFGDFGDPTRYNGIVPSEDYLTEVLNREIEADEINANQHTACLPIDQLAIDDSHKVNKHVAKADGIPIFGALWTAMDSKYIIAQALTLTKAHDERLGPLRSLAGSVDKYGYEPPKVVFSDDPIK